MRRSASLIIPLSIILMYYGLWVVLTWFLLKRYPAFHEFFPVGGIDALASSSIDSCEPVYTSVERELLSPASPLRLFLASGGAAIFTVPISWVYFITSRSRRIDQSFLQTIVILPIVVTGIAMIHVAVFVFGIPGQELHEFSGDALGAEFE